MKFQVLAIGLLITSLLTVACQKSFRALGPTADAAALASPDAAPEAKPETTTDPEAQPATNPQPVNTELFLMNAKSLSFRIDDRTTLTKVLHQITGKNSEKIHIAVSNGTIISSDDIPKSIEAMELVCALYSMHNQLPPQDLALESTKISEKYASTSGKTFVRQTSITLQNGSETLVLQCQRKGFASLSELKKTFTGLATVTGK